MKTLSQTSICSRFGIYFIDKWDSLITEENFRLRNIKESLLSSFSLMGILQGFINFSRNPRIALFVHTCTPSAGYGMRWTTRYLGGGPLCMGHMGWVPEARGKRWPERQSARSWGPLLASPVQIVSASRQHGHHQVSEAYKTINTHSSFSLNTMLLGIHC